MRTSLTTGWIVICFISGFARASDTLSFHAECKVVRTEFSDAEILAATFAHYQVPDGFYEDHLREGESLYYVNTISIHLDPMQRGPWVELCTNDIDQASARDVATETHNSGPRRILTHARETEKFFEFRREEDRSPPRHAILSRVHKCSYLDRSAFNRRAHYYIQDFSGWYQGTLHAKPITPERVRELGEYLWYILYDNARGVKVVSSFTSDLGNEILHTMYTLRIVVTVNEGVSITPPKRPSPPRELHDINLVRLDYHVDKKSGDVSLDSQDIRTIQAWSNPPEIIVKNRPGY